MAASQPHWNAHGHADAEHAPQPLPLRASLSDRGDRDNRHIHDHHHGPPPPVPGPRPPPRPSSSSASGRAHPLHSHSHSTSSTGTGNSSEYFESVVSMLSILSSADETNAHRALLAITNSPESCLALRKAGCIPLLIQILHPVNLPPNEHPSAETKARASRALKNILHFNPDERQKRKELRVLRLLESIRAFSEDVRAHPHLHTEEDSEECSMVPEPPPHPVQSTTTLMKLSFDEEHRSTMCHLGAIHAFADLIQADYIAHGLNLNPECIITRRYGGMILTNLTYGDGTNKALLCSMSKFLAALVAQLQCQNEDVCQVTASVLRNLSWHADSNSRVALRDSNVVSKLATAAIRASKESTLKAILSALWNLSAHSVANKCGICQTEHAVEFLIGLLNYKSKTQTLTIVENAGGILRNVATILSATDNSTSNSNSSDNCKIVSVQLRDQFRDYGLIEILLDHLRSSSLTVVSNSCGTLWHISAGCPQDQQTLLDLGAMPKLKALMYSKHERISQGASAAFKNLLCYTTKNVPTISQNTHSPLRLRAEENEHDHQPQHSPIDLRRSIDVDRPPSLPLRYHNQGSSAETAAVELQEEPLDLSMHSSKSSPIHVVSATEFGASRSATATPPFLNPPLHGHSGHGGHGHSHTFHGHGSSSSISVGGVRKYYSQAHAHSHNHPPKNYNSSSCPELMTVSAGPTTPPIAPTILEDTTTNYSLHFTESEEPPGSGDHKDDCAASAGAAEAEESDTIKTYYCEGTPLNFSTSNSMSDLTQLDKAPRALQPIVEAETGAGGACAAVDGEDACSGQDQPKKYCTEHTPAVFSRSSSLSSIASSNNQGGENQAEPFLEERSGNLPPLPPPQPAARQIQSSTAPLAGPAGPAPALREKVKRNVTFSANETPLMFSRSSSVNSLGSIDMNYEDGDADGDADGGSVLSEFSRRTSEAVSPSDLPDSPRQLGDRDHANENAPTRFPMEVKAELGKTEPNGPPEGDEEEVKVFATGGGESAPATGAASVRSLSPLTVDGESVGVSRPMENTPRLRVPVKPILKHRQGQDVNQLNVSQITHGVDELRIFAIEGTPFGVSNATSLSDIIGEFDKEMEAVTNGAIAEPEPQSKSAEGVDLAEAPLEEETQETSKNPAVTAADVEGGENPPPPPKSDDNEATGQVPDAAKTKTEVTALEVEEEPIYSDAQILMKCIRAGKAAKRQLPKSKSEFSDLNAVSSTKEAKNGEKNSAAGVKTSTSYHEDLVAKSKAKSIDGELDIDEDLAALIQKGKNKARSSLRSGHGGQRKLPHPIVTQPLGGNGANPKEATTIAKEPNKVEEPEQKDSSTPAIQQSVLSIASMTASEWNDDTPTISSTIPSMSISSAFRMVEERERAKEKDGNDPPPKPDGVGIANAVMIESTLTSVQPPSMLSAVSSTECKRKTYTKHARGDTYTHSDLFNQKPPPDFDMENSMISVASLPISEIASMASTVGVDGIELGMNELNIGRPTPDGEGETFTIDGSLAASTSAFDDGTDIDDCSLRDDVSGSISLSMSFGENRENRKFDQQNSRSIPPDRFSTFTKSPTATRSPKQRRQEDPARYLTRTITPTSTEHAAVAVDANGNTNTSNSNSPTNQFATFRVDKSTKGSSCSSSRPLAATTTTTSNESSPAGSPRGIRGRRKQLYASLPPQQRKGHSAPAPPIPPPKPRTSTGGGSPSPSPTPTTPTPTTRNVFVRPTRSSELRAAQALNSRDSSPKRGHTHAYGGSKSVASSRNSSMNSLNNVNAGSTCQSQASGFAPPKKVPPKPPVRSSTSSSVVSTASASTSAKNFAIVRAVRNSNSSIGFLNEKQGVGASEVTSPYSTLPRSGKGSNSNPNGNRNGNGVGGAPQKEKEGKVGRLSNFWNQLTKNKSEKDGRMDTKPLALLKNGNGDPDFDGGTTGGGGAGLTDKKTRFGIGFSFGKKKKDAHTTHVWVKRDEPTSMGVGVAVGRERERERAFVLPFNYNRQPSAGPPAASNDLGNSGQNLGTTSKMTTV